MLIIAQVMDQVLSFHEYRFYKSINCKNATVLSCLINFVKQKTSYLHHFVFHTWSLKFEIVLHTLHCKSYLLSPWCRVLLEKLAGLQLVKKFPAFHGTRRFITALTSVRHLSKHHACECFLTKFFLEGGVVSTAPNPQAGEPPLVGRPRLLIQFIRSYPPYRAPFLCSFYKTNHFRLHHSGSIYRKGGSELAKLGHVEFKETSHILLGTADKKYEKSGLWIPASWDCNFYMFTPGKIRQFISEVRDMTVPHIKYFSHVPQSSMHRRPTGRKFVSKSLLVSSIVRSIMKCWPLERATPLHLETKDFSTWPS